MSSYTSQFTCFRRFYAFRDPEVLSVSGNITTVHVPRRAQYFVRQQRFYDLCSRATCFETRPGQRLSEMRIFMTSPVHSSIYQNKTVKRATPASFHIQLCSQFINSTIRRCAFSAFISSLKKVKVIRMLSLVMWKKYRFRPIHS